MLQDGFADAADGWSLTLVLMTLCYPFPLRVLPSLVLVHPSTWRTIDVPRFSPSTLHAGCDSAAALLAVRAASAAALLSVGHKTWADRWVPTSVELLLRRLALAELGEDAGGAAAPEDDFRGQLSVRTALLDLFGIAGWQQMRSTITARPAAADDGPVAVAEQPRAVSMLGAVLGRLLPVRLCVGVGRQQPAQQEPARIPAPLSGGSARTLLEPLLADVPSEKGCVLLSVLRQSGGHGPLLEFLGKWLAEARHGEAVTGAAYLRDVRRWASSLRPPVRVEEELWLRGESLPPAIPCYTAALASVSTEAADEMRGGGAPPTADELRKWHRTQIELLLLSLWREGVHCPATLRRLHRNVAEAATGVPLDEDVRWPPPVCPVLDGMLLALRLPVEPSVSAAAALGSNLPLVAAVRPTLVSSLPLRVRRACVDGAKAAGHSLTRQYLDDTGDR
eukprot:TRINITY_DN19369_c0_g1_i2.p1 TRINITY_DN19369_c0_g1~~TRINITY_DN19369_c0_g1_i2.p1  ORF type:complete len:449 (+),score=185.87 TRINITY_DN19369_c0_g1_i2:884-2230(+)